MTELLSATQMRAIEQAAIDNGKVTGLEMMERAGAGVVEAIFEEWPELGEGDRLAVVLCGPGNNGGDGFVVARLLRERGWAVEVFLYGDQAKLPPDAAQNCRRWQDLGKIGIFDSFNPPTCDFDLVVDALFGIGMSRPMPIHALIDEAVGMCDQADRHLVAIDVPTGLVSDTGRVVEPRIYADLTVTFHREKLCHRLQDGPSYCGKVVIKDIGL